jgi:hypothetical protein
MHTPPAVPSTNAEPPQQNVADRPDLEPATEVTAKPKAAEDKALGLRLHAEPPDSKRYRDGYPPTPRRMFGSGN